MNLRRLAWNMGSAAGQFALSAAVLLVLYGYIIRQVGVDLFGIWATVAATASVAGVGGLGFSGGVVKFVARYRALGDPTRAAGVVTTSVSSVMLAIGLLSVASLALLPPLLSVLMEEPAELELAVRLVPYVAVSFWFASVSAVTVSSLDGFNRVDVRSGVQIVSMLIYAAGVVLLLPRQGIVGLVLAQILQGASVLVLSWVLLGRLSGQGWLRPWRWSRDIFREVLSYGLSIQAMGIAQILFEPVTKAFLTRFGGVEATGLFELANRIAFQARSVVDAGHRAVVPSLAEMHESDPSGLHAVYERSARILVLVAGIATPALLLGLPVIGAIWLGKTDDAFLAMGTVLAVTWMLNLVSTPAYYANLATGALRWNVIGTVTTAVVNVLFGWILGYAFAAWGVLAAYALSLLTGNLLTSWHYHAAERRSALDAYVGRGDAPFLAAGTLLAAVSAVAAGSLYVRLGVTGYVVVAALALAAVLVPTALRHSGMLVLREGLARFRGA